MKKPDASWNPVIMSTVVYPGIGQWMQKRQTAGSVYIAFFTVVAGLFALTLFTYLSEVVPIIRDALSGRSIEGRVIPPLSAIIKPFAIVVFIYLANVVDVLRGRHQLRSQPPQEQP